MPLLLLFILVPLIEIGLFIQVGGWLGLWPTLAIVVFTALLGTWMLRQQGFAELARLRQSMQQLRDPTESLAHGAMILFAGALLLTPGFFTDTVGFLLLVPGFRRMVMRNVRARVNVASFQMGQGPNRAHEVEPDIIETDYVDLGDSKPGNSGWTKH